MKRSDLTLDERYLIHNAVLGGLVADEIARILRRDRSTIYQELKRGRRHLGGAYCPHRAQRRRDRSRWRCGLNALGKPTELWQTVKQQLKEGYTPDEVAGRLRCMAAHGQVSVNAIYKHVWQHRWQRWLKSIKRRQHLKRPARRRWSGTALPIQQRSLDAALRIEFGHFEADSMLGKRSDKKRVVVAVERQSLFTCLLLVSRLDARSVARQLKRRLKACGLPFVSVTTDRGWEFTALGDYLPAQAYVCDPHAPNQRGTNENQIGRLRIDLPKGVSMNHLSARKLKRIEDKHNNTPRKVLGYLTPFEVAFNCPPPVGIWG
jgi:transposase, IS30 family